MEPIIPEIPSIDSLTKHLLDWFVVPHHSERHKYEDIMRMVAEQMQLAGQKMLKTLQDSGYQAAATIKDGKSEPLKFTKAQIQEAEKLRRPQPPTGTEDVIAGLVEMLHQQSPKPLFTWPDKTPCEVNLDVTITTGCPSDPKMDERNFPMPRISDIAHTSNPQYEKLTNDKKMDALRDRTVKVDVSALSDAPNGIFRCNHCGASYLTNNPQKCTHCYNHDWSVVELHVVEINGKKCQCKICHPEYQCSKCGCGITSGVRLTACPMCQELTGWTVKKTVSRYELQPGLFFSPTSFISQSINNLLNDPNTSEALRKFIRAEPVTGDEYDQFPQEVINLVRAWRYEQYYGGKE